MEELLFIGGPADGKRMRVDGCHTTVYIPAAPDPLRWRTTLSECFAKHEYHRSAFRDKHGELEAMVWEHLEGSVISALMKGYRKPMEGES